MVDGICLKCSVNMFGGARYESDTYICLLMDSLYRTYPIGGIVLWETIKPVPFREFIKNYAPGHFTKQVDEGRWGDHKFLVYDGQQRLQTLYSILHHRYNGRALHFDLLFDPDCAEADETGFFFAGDRDIVGDTCIRMTRLCNMRKGYKERAELEATVLKCRTMTNAQELTVRGNLATLWDVFVDTNVKSIAYYPVQSDDENQVNEVFRRLNTGGIALTQNELVFSKIKATEPDFEERLWESAAEIKKVSAGFEFSSAEILQFLYLLVFRSTKIDEGRVKSKHIGDFCKYFVDSKPALLQFFRDYLWNLFRINHKGIMPRGQALLPIMAYLASLKSGGHPFEIKRFQDDRLRAIHQYLILSQCCDWNTPTMVSAFAGQAIDAGTAGKGFPLDVIRKIAVGKHRLGTLYYDQFLSIPCFALKILTPGRQYIFDDLFRPQVDHIFPSQLEGGNDAYKSRVDVLWNFQPLPAAVNNYKRAKHPLKFFESAEGKKYFEDYDFLPPLTSTCWTDDRKFIRFRHRAMRRSLLKRYGLKLERERPTPQSRQRKPFIIPPATKQ